MNRAQECILKIAHYLTINKCTLRDIFKMNIFDEILEGKEFELLPIRVFSEIAKGEFGLEDKHI